MNFQFQNIALFETHKETYDALLKEAAALRKEAREMAVAYAQLPSEHRSDEMFRLFLRDLHVAHDELNARLHNMNNEMTNRELQNRDGIIEQLRAENAKLFAQRERLEKEKEYLERELGTVRGEYSSLKDTFNYARAHVRELLNPIFNDSCEGWKNDEQLPFKSTLEFLYVLNDWIMREEGDLDRLEKGVEGLGERYEKSIRESIEAMWQASGHMQHKAEDVEKDNREGLATKGGIIFGSNGKDTFFKASSEHIQQMNQHHGELRRCLEKVGNALTAWKDELLANVKNALRVPRDKNEPIRKRVDENSPLFKLISYLRDNC